MHHAVYRSQLASAQAALGFIKADSEEAIFSSQGFLIRTSPNKGEERIRKPLTWEDGRSGLWTLFEAFLIGSFRTCT